MSSAADRFRQRKSVAPAVCPSGELSIDGHGKTDLLASAHLSLDLAATPATPDALLANAHEILDAEKVGALIEACRRECLEAVVRPFLIGRVLFADKDGGNVDTVHNARAGTTPRSRNSSSETASSIAGLYFKYEVLEMPQAFRASGTLAPNSRNRLNSSISSKGWDFSKAGGPNRALRPPRCACETW